MKKLVLLFSILFISKISNAQFVTITDVNFKNILAQNLPTCFDDKGQLDTTCKELLNLESLTISNSKIADLNGIKYLKRLKYLDCSKNELTFIPKLPDSLDFFQASDNQIKSISRLPSGLRLFYIQSNELEAIDSLPESLIDLVLANNKLISLPEHLPENLNLLAVFSNEISVLPELPNSLTQLYCFDMPNLKCMPHLPDNLTNLGLMTSSIKCIPNLPNTLKVFLDFSTTPINTYPVCNEFNNQNNCSGDLITSINKPSTQVFPLYPNPVVDFINIPNLDYLISYEIFNNLGESVIEQSQNSISNQINVSNLESGIYIIKLYTENEEFAARFVK